MEPTLKVMLSSGSCEVPVASWSKGEKHVMREALNDTPDVQICASGPLKDGKPGSASLVTRLFPWRGQFVCPDGSQLEVQSFRYMSSTGDMGYMLWCADCGALRRIDNGHLQRHGCAPCERCGALPVGAGCPRWHNWGTCPECKPTPAEVSAAQDLGESRSIASARRSAAAVEGARPGGGPPAAKAGALGKLAGSAGERRVGEELATDPGFDRVDVSG